MIGFSAQNENKKKSIFLPLVLCGFRFSGWTATFQRLQRVKIPVCFFPVFFSDFLFQMKKAFRTAKKLFRGRFGLFSVRLERFVFPDVEFHFPNNKSDPIRSEKLTSLFIPE